MYSGFPKKAINHLRCPYDRGRLNLIGSHADRIHTGKLICEDPLNHIFMIRDGILRLITDSSQLGPIMQSEIKVRDTQANQYDVSLEARHDKEVPSTLRAVGQIEGNKIIEYGCGTGRFTIHLQSASLLLATDFSIKSLEILAPKLNSTAEIGLIQADITFLVTAPDVFDVAILAQVIEHIPTSRERQRLYWNIRHSLCLNGIIVASVYHFDLRRRWSGCPREGYHKSGIFYHYFTKTELTGELGGIFQSTKLTPIDITWPGEARLRLTKFFGGFLSRLAEAIPFVRNLGHLILIRAKKEETRYHWGLIDRYLFKKHWFWFTEPRDIPRAAMVNFFSYHPSQRSDFQERVGLTTLIDLQFSIEELWNRLRPNLIQKQIKRGQRNGIMVECDNNYSGFRKLYSLFRRSRGLSRERLKPLWSMARIFSAYYHGRLIAGGLFITDGQIMRAWALASIKRDRSVSGVTQEIIGQANRMVIWEAIQYAKLIGCKQLDLGGISPNSPDVHLRSLAEFKEAFGGRRVNSYYYFKVYSSALKLWLRWRNFKNI